MARKSVRRKITERPVEEEVLEENLEGFPRHGDEYNDEGLEPAAPSPDEGDEPGPDPQPDTLEGLRARLDATNEELRLLRQERIQHNANRPQPPAPTSEPEPKWGEQLFEDPDGTLKRYGDHIRRQTIQEVEQRYTADQGQKEFWTSFYSDNRDLREDKDLVLATMQSNMAALQDLPWPEASKRLAALTRDRISRYRGTGNGNGQRQRLSNRTVVEGSSNPSPSPRSRPEPEGPVTLGQLIKARRGQRNQAQSRPLTRAFAS